MELRLYKFQGLTGGALALGSSPEDEYNNIQKFTEHSGVYKRDITLLQISSTLTHSASSIMPIIGSV